MSYRVEISATKTAGCQATHCKKENVKIQKGEIRQGVLVQVRDHSSMKWRHWGCVTPSVLHNWWESADGDFELIDGLDSMPDDAQEKVKRALQQEHVDDEDFNGDLECNRYNGKNQGMFLTDKQRAALHKGDDDEGEEKKPAKKRGRAAKAEDEDEEPAKPAAKKARGKKETNADADDAAPAKKGRGRPKKETAAEQDEEVEAAPKKARGRPRKAAASTDAAVDDEVPEEAEAAPKKARGRPRKSLPADEEVEESGEAVPEKKARGRPRKSVAADVDEDEEAPAKKTKGRPKKAAQPQAASDDADKAPKKGRGRPRKSVGADEE